MKAPIVVHQAMKDGRRTGHSPEGTNVSRPLGLPSLTGFWDRSRKPKGGGHEFAMDTWPVPPFTPIRPDRSSSFQKPVPCECSRPASIVGFPSSCPMTDETRVQPTGWHAVQSSLRSPCMVQPVDLLSPPFARAPVAPGCPCLVFDCLAFLLLRRRQLMVIPISKRRMAAKDLSPALLPLLPLLPLPISCLPGWGAWDGASVHGGRKSGGMEAMEQGWIAGTPGAPDGIGRRGLESP